MCYIAASVVLSLDKKGKEAYFSEDTTERTLLEAIDVKKNTQTLNIRTDDWGYIQRTFERNSDTFWNKYDIFLAVLVTGGVTGVYWIILSIIDIKKYKNCNWNRAVLVLYKILIV